MPGPHWPHRGNPRKGPMAKVLKTFCLDTETDAELLRYIETLASRGKMSSVIRQALKAYMNVGVITLADVMRRLDEIEQRGLVLRTGDFAPKQADTDEPAAAAAALDKLAELGK